MKTTMLLAAWMLIAFFGKAQAQNDPTQVNGIDKNSTLRDTISIQLKGSNKLLLIGKDVKEMAQFKQGDSIKTLFLTDWDKAIEMDKNKMDAKLVHYFVHASGKRRLKFQNADFMEPQLNVAAELTRLDLDLPNYEYILHCNKELEMHVYMSNPENLATELGSISIDETMVLLTKNKKDFKRNYKYFIATDSSKYRISGTQSLKLDEIELSPAAGIGMIASEIAPVLGFDLNLSLNDKYRYPAHKIGLSFSAFGFAKFQKGDITDYAPVFSYDLKYLSNFNKHNPKPKWMGLGVGLLQSKENESLNNKFKLDLLFGNIGPFELSYDVIFINRSQSLYSMKLMWSF